MKREGAISLEKWRNGTRNKATISDLWILVQDLKEGSNSPLKKDRTGLMS
jgi:hypothetical protein